jgi:drug/metabolite transporter (DMT)-like permease
MFAPWSDRMARLTERHTNTRFGYALAATAATMWALNGSLARFLLDDGVSAPHLSELRSAVSWLVLVVALALFSRRRLRIAREDVPKMAWLGIAGLAAVHALYFFAIERLEIGVALVIQYLGPLLILIWLRVFHGRRLAPSLWGAVAVSVVGCFFVVEAYDADDLSGIGLLAAFGAAVTFAVYLIASERAGHRYEAYTTLAWGFGFATLFWLVVRPPWTFPFEQFDNLENLAIGVLGVAIVGTLIPFLLMLAALRHLPATRASVVATLEPVLAALIAWPVHEETLGPPQILGGLLVVGAVVWVQAHPPSPEVEAVPVNKRPEKLPRTEGRTASCRDP